MPARRQRLDFLPNAELVQAHATRRRLDVRDRVFPCVICGERRRRDRVDRGRGRARDALHPGPKRLQELLVRHRVHVRGDERRHRAVRLERLQEPPQASPLARGSEGRSIRANVGVEFKGV
eukprot:29312-Pelagococcus_subviridis.AAC.1